MVAAYPDADEFVTRLNSCVQAARSVTFVLQKELRHHDWFADWYSDWQRRMKDDVAMRWLGPREAIQAVKLQGELPERVRRQAVIFTRTRWTVPELPEGELLDTLGHCYGMLGAIVREAHEHCGVEMRTSAVRRMRGNAHPSGRLDCMLSTAEMRTAYWHLGEETLITAVAEEVEAPEEERLDEAAKYGLDEGQHRIAPGHRCR